jgi:regulator of sirC expression with transglutaminase-like and TPR domain
MNVVNTVNAISTMSTTNAALGSLLPAHVSPSEFEAITHLLDDSDRAVVESVHNKLKSYGGAIVPALQHLYEHEEDAHARDFLLSLIREMRNDALQTLLEHIHERSESGKDIDLEESLILLSKFGYPETNSDEVKERLDALALRVHALYVKAHNPTELGLLLSINQAFFEEEGFSGVQDDDDYHNPDGSYAHRLLQRKRGIPISLSVLYILVAERAGVSLHGVGMPAHFVVYHPELDVYIDAFNNGAFLTYQDCKKFIAGAGFAFEPSMLERATNLAIVLRMLRNLIFAYTKADAMWDVAALQEVSHTIIETMNQ